MISRNRQRWTTEEDKKLIDMYVRNKNYEYMASELQRTEDAVKARFVKIYLVKYLYDKKKNFSVQKYSLCKLYKINEDDLVRYLKYAGIDTTEYDLSDIEEFDDEESDIEEHNDDYEVSDVNIKQNIANILQSMSRKMSIIGSVFMIYTAYKAIIHGMNVYYKL